MSIPPQRYRTESAAAVGLKAIGYVESLRFLIFGAILLFLLYQSRTIANSRCCLQAILIV
jgi:hypothetical protein